MQATKPDPVSLDEQLTASEMLSRGREVLTKRFWWFAVAFVAVTAATYVVTKHQQRIYKATGSMVIERRPPKVLNGVSEVVSLGAQGYWGSKQYYEAQRQILKSRELAALVINRHGLAADPHLFGLDRPGLELTEAQKRDIMANSDAIAAVASRVSVDLGESSMIARVSIEDSDPAYAQQLVNWILRAYRDRNLNTKRRATREAYKDLKTIVKDMGSKKQASENALLAFETRYDLSTNHRQAIKDDILTLARNLRSAERQRLIASQHVRTMRRYQKGTDLFSVGAKALVEDSLTQLLKQRYLTLSIQKRELEAVYLDKHPKVRTIESQLVHLRKIAKKHLRAALVGAKRSLGDAMETEKVVRQKLSKVYKEDAALRKAELKYEQLKAKRNEDRGFYELVAKRLAETDLTGQVEVNNVSILDEAVLPRVPIRPKKRLNYALGILLGLLVGLGAALSAELLDNTVKDRLQIEQRLGLAYLGAIPTYQLGDVDDETEIPVESVDLYAHYRPNSRVAEASRSIRTNLLFMRSEKPLRSMVITSAHPREGKTSTSTTIAIALANSSGSCVLVDTDLRKPRLHKVFGLSAEHGVTNFILNPNADVSTLTQQTEVPGLHLLASGPLPPDSSRILHNERFMSLVEELKKKFEVVIFDSPPVEIVSDALVLSRLTDGVVVVAHAKTTRMTALTSTVRALRNVNATVLGMVLSRTQETGTGYGYYYGHGYRGGRRSYQYRYGTDGPDTDDDSPVLSES
ncbi:MAG: polysaccharide biosynthesis tyrosine autokinase [Myxococcales bacterium]|nr:polysaccharide biosynthesis tyrosine autokinase [Myxococcales bacterium]